MSGRKQDLIIFFDENKRDFCDEYEIKNRLVRLYMNRFIIDEDDETEIIDVHEIRERTWKEHEDCFFKTLNMTKQKEEPNTDMHFIIPFSIVHDGIFARNNRDHLEKKTRVFMKDRLTNQPNLLGNSYAFTILEGFHFWKIVSENYRKNRYYYQEEEEQYEQQPLALAKPRRRRSINDDLEWFRRRIIDFGITHRNLVDEDIYTFHYELLDDNQISRIKKEVQDHNNSRSFLQRWSGTHPEIKLTQTDPSDNYLEYNCKRRTFYF